jgi:molecular chaperone GrpE
MTEVDDRLTGISSQLAELQDLFRRRLLDDREKRQTISVLQTRVDELEKATSVEAARPLVNAVALVLDRITGQQAPDAAFLHSISDELIALLEAIGVKRIDVTEQFDARRHEVVQVQGGSGGGLKVVGVVRHGYEKAGMTLRAAQVAVERVELLSPGAENPNPEG